MTIQFKAQWQQYEANGVYTLNGAEETRLIGLGIAVAYTPTFSERGAQVTRNASTGSPAGLIDPATGQAVGTGGSKTDRVKAALRVSSAAAWGNNIRANDPWFLPRQVARNTYYALNNVVLGDDGQSMYLCRDDGITATTGALTGGTNRVAITDGTARFVYAGRARSVFGTQQNVMSVTTRALGIPAGARASTRRGHPRRSGRSPTHQG